MTAVNPYLFGTGGGGATTDATARSLASAASTTANALKATDVVSAVPDATPGAEKIVVERTDGSTFDIDMTAFAGGSSTAATTVWDNVTAALAGNPANVQAAVEAIDAQMDTLNADAVTQDASITAEKNRNDAQDAKLTPLETHAANTGIHVPAGGTTGQGLRKTSAVDGATEWGDVGATPRDDVRATGTAADEAVKESGIRTELDKHPLKTDLAVRPYNTQAAADLDTANIPLNALVRIGTAKPYTVRQWDGAAFVDVVTGDDAPTLDAATEWKPATAYDAESFWYTITAPVTIDGNALTAGDHFFRYTNPQTSHATDASNDFANWTYIGDPDAVLGDHYHVLTASKAFVLSTDFADENQLYLVWAVLSATSITSDAGIQRVGAVVTPDFAMAPGDTYLAIRTGTALTFFKRAAPSTTRSDVRATGLTGTDKVDETGIRAAIDAINVNGEIVGVADSIANLPAVPADASADVKYHAWVNVGTTDTPGLYVPNATFDAWVLAFAMTPPLILTLAEMVQKAGATEYDADKAGLVYVKGLDAWAQSRSIRRVFNATGPFDMTALTYPDKTAIFVRNADSANGIGITYGAGGANTLNLTNADGTSQVTPGQDSFTIQPSEIAVMEKDGTDVFVSVFPGERVSRFDTHAAANAFGALPHDGLVIIRNEDEVWARRTGTNAVNFPADGRENDDWFKLSGTGDAIDLPASGKPVKNRHHLFTGDVTLDGTDVVAGGRESYYFKLYGSGSGSSLTGPGFSKISHSGNNPETIHLMPHPTNDGEFEVQNRNPSDVHDHEVLENVAVHVRSAGTNASSSVDIELLIDGAWNPTDWVVSTTPVTGLTAHTGATVLHLDKAAITGPITIGHNKEGYLFFEYVGDATTGQLTGVNYTGANNANSDGEIIVNFAGTNQAVTFANKAAVVATDLEFEQQPEAASSLEIVRYTADGAIQDKDHRAIFETGAVNMALAASTTNRLIQMVSEGPVTIITANGAEEFTSSGGTSTDQKLTINETFKWATIIGRTAAGWSQYVGQVGLPAGVDESTPTKFKAGTRLVQNGVNVGSGTVTFPEAFKAGTTPTVMVLPFAPGDNSNVTLQSVSETGFNAWIVRNESDVGQSKDIHWIAIGERN